MAKELKGKVDFELSEKFWKTYKPDSVKKTGLSDALRKFEKARKAAEKIEKGSGPAIEKSNAWGVALKEINALLPIMKKTMAALGKDKHKNLLDSLTKAQNELKRGSHVLLESIEKRKSKWYLEATKAQGEDSQWLDRLVAKSDRKDIRKWSAVSKEFVKLTGDQDFPKIDTVLKSVKTLSREGFFKGMTGAKTFKSDCARQHKAVKDYRTALNTVWKEYMAALRSSPRTYNYIEDLEGDLELEEMFFAGLK